LSSMRCDADPYDSIRKQTLAEILRRMIRFDFCGREWRLTNIDANLVFSMCRGRTSTDAFAA
jgi:hypothetical protein